MVLTTQYTKGGSKLRDFLDLEMLGSDVSTDSKHRYHNSDLVPCSCIDLKSLVPITLTLCLEYHQHLTTVHIL